MVHKPGQGHRVGQEPVVGVLPTGGDLALGREVDDVFRLELVQQTHDPRDVLVQVELSEGVAVLPVPPDVPLVRQKDLALLGRTADADDLVARVLKEQVHEVRA
jgi:hypothetical protein